MAKKYCIARHSVVSCRFGRRAKAEDIERPNFKNQIGGFVAWVQSTTNFSQMALLDKKLIVKDAKSDGSRHVAAVFWLTISECVVGYALKMTTVKK